MAAITICSDLGAQKSLQMVIAAMKLWRIKDCPQCSLSGVGGGSVTHWRRRTALSGVSFYKYPSRQRSAALSESYLEDSDPP